MAVANNLWVNAEELPEIALSRDLGAQRNVAVTHDEVDVQNVPKRTTEAVVTPAVVERWYESSGRVLKDKAGTLRSEPATVGAYERAEGATRDE